MGQRAPRDTARAAPGRRVGGGGGARSSFTPSRLLRSCGQSTRYCHARSAPPAGPSRRTNQRHSVVHPLFGAAAALAQVKGMGEKQIEVDRRLLKGRMARLRRDLDDVGLGCVCGGWVVGVGVGWVGVGVGWVGGRGGGGVEGLSVGVGWGAPLPPRFKALGCRSASMQCKQAPPNPAQPAPAHPSFLYPFLPLPRLPLAGPHAQADVPRQACGSPHPRCCPGRVHQRRKVDAAQFAHRRRGAGRR